MAEEKIKKLEDEKLEDVSGGLVTDRPFDSPLKDTIRVADGFIDGGDTIRIREEGDGFTAKRLKSDIRGGND